ncbi:MAG: Ldh family oxidoreductase, partial [Algicola sp.]|nr:Ldh family oxidoreductase [Algicola sp.]
MNTICADKVEKIILAAAQDMGLNPAHGKMLAQGLIEPTLRGVDSHGIRLLSTYMEEVKGGRANANPNFNCRASLPAVLQFDADNALGVIAAYSAADEVAKIAKIYGIGAVAVKNANHFGAASNYTLALARQGLIGLSMSNADALVAPFGGTEKCF